MKIQRILLPSLALGAAALLVAPTQEASGFATLGFGLSISQRDFRIFNNFADASANNNLTPDTSFPGYQGAVMAIWKACVEWGAELHGDGNGDPHQNGGLGSGGANFDADFQGEATGIGGGDDNVHSSVSSCGGGGVLAFTEAPGSNGWRIRYCEEFTWQDGPGTSIGGGIDLQGVACHEYGHALGLGHTSASGATMTPAISGNGVNARSIATDDINGVLNVYGAKAATKPRITGVTVNTGGTVTITGQNFTGTGNEVRFTQKAKGGNGNPVTVSNASSTAGGTSITVSIPSTAGPGDVLVKRGDSTAFSSLSNAWPIDPGTSGGPGPGTGPNIASVSPGTIQAVSPNGLALTLSGSGFTNTTGVKIDGISLLAFPPEFVVTNDSTITLARVPLLSKLGAVSIEVTATDGTDTVNVNVVTNSPPVVDLLSSDPGFLLNAIGADVVMGGKAFDLFFLTASPTLLPSSLPGIVNLGIGNNFSTLLFLGDFSVDPVKGYTKINLPFTLPSGAKFFLQAGVLPFGANFPLLATNIESGTVLF